MEAQAPLDASHGASLPQAPPEPPAAVSPADLSQAAQQPPQVIKPNKQQEGLPAMAFLQEVVRQEGFEISDITNYKYEITDLHQAPGKDHFQGTVRREFECMTQNGPKKFIIEQEINVGIRVPDPSASEGRALKEAKMRALFAIDGHESVLQDTINLTNQVERIAKIEELAKKAIMHVRYDRAAKSEGFYGKTVRWLETPPAKTAAGKIARFVERHGSIKGVIINNKPLKSSETLNEKWTRFENVPCGIIDKREGHFHNVVSAIKDITIDRSFNHQSYLERVDRESRAPNDSHPHLDELNKLKATLSSSPPVSVNSLCNSLAHDTADKIDELTLKLTEDRLGVSPEGAQNIVGHNDAGGGFEREKKELIDRYNTLTRQIEEEEQKTGEGVNVGPRPSIDGALEELKKERGKIGQLLTAPMMLHHIMLSAIQDRIKALEFIVTCCPDLIQPKENIDIYKKNIKFLKETLSKANLETRVEAFRDDVHRDIKAELWRPSPPGARRHKPPVKPLPSAPPQAQAAAQPAVQAAGPQPAAQPLQQVDRQVNPNQAAAAGAPQAEPQAEAPQVAGPPNPSAAQQPQGTPQDETPPE